MDASGVINESTLNVPQSHLCQSSTREKLEIDAPHPELKKDQCGLMFKPKIKRQCFLNSARFSQEQLHKRNIIPLFIYGILGLQLFREF